MAIIWFLAGVLFTLAALVLILPRLREVPAMKQFSALPWQAGAGASVLAMAALGLYLGLGHSQPADQPMAARGGMFTAPNSIGNAAAGPSAFASAASAFASAAKASENPATPAPKSAGSMGSAIASLEARLAKGGGTPDDWELLAKSYEFLGRPADASKARAHQLPPLPLESNDGSGMPGTGPMGAAPAMTGAAPALPSAPQRAAAGTVVSGEVSLAPALKAKAAAGATLFIVAKSVDSPGPPVAVFRGSVGTWPVNFTLDDSQSMLPGRNLSSAGRVTIEARISQSGQPLPAAGDLQGSTGVINPGDHHPLKIVIDRVIG